MSDEKKSPTRADALDDFWDIDRLIPERPARRGAARPRPTPEAVEIEVPVRVERASDTVQTVAPATAPATAPAVAASPITEAARTAPRRPAPPAQNGGGAPVTHYVPPHTAAEEEEPLLDYRPDGVLLHRVRVFAWHSNFHYFDQFVGDATRYAGMEPPAEMPRRETFFSYFPQYVQLNRRQAAWYLWWRGQVRSGVLPDTDYAYVLLYIFELINLEAPDAETARRHRDALAAVWVAYRRAYPQLDHYMCEWLCDYCLIHALPAPLELLSPALDAIIAGSRLKEFYLVSVIDPSGGRADRPLATARILMRHCCQYDYRKSKFAQGEHKALFDRTIPAAVAAALPLLLGGPAGKPVITMLDSTVTRDAYTGALCAYQNKRRVEVAYTSFSRSHELRFLIGDMVKHVENRLRGWIGVRSRLSVMSLPIPLRDALDAYLNPLAPAKSAPSAKKKEAPRPDYEALYDLPAKPLSLADAAAIEAESWETTRILTEAFAEEEPPVEAPTKAPANASVPVTAAPPVSEPVSEATPPPAAPLAREGSTPFGALTPFIAAALAGDATAQRAAATSLGKMLDAIADAVNAITAEGEIGDIVLEDDGTGFYAVIEDYRVDVDNLLATE